jgi:hypothetical protein
VKWSQEIQKTKYPQRAEYNGAVKLFVGVEEKAITEKLAARSFRRGFSRAEQRKQIQLQQLL